jgi:catechol 2,3-dioxygenase-like lactoylglutathione lyase family enzyme
MRLLFATFLFLATIPANAQKEPLPKLDPYFTAIITKDLEASLPWYTEVLGFEVQDQAASEERGFKQANLQREGILLELIELDQAVVPEEALPGYTPRTRLTGLFKTGFLAPEFERWMDHFREKGVEPHGGVVTDPHSGKKMVILKDPDGNRVQIFGK